MGCIVKICCTQFRNFYRSLKKEGVFSQCCWVKPYNVLNIYIWSGPCTITLNVYVQGFLAILIKILIYFDLLLLSQGMQGARGWLWPTPQDLLRTLILRIAL
ncbi:hypothetical protein [Holospora curviuscula]|uniref:Uncharacterized protein n=1 Tax=Holospora curviuscula TaxID=1082868 RepID=A0A2S5R9I3_9PROT|nr:hypothetical protein [Holospora curviuscula]PPE03986.1 hypothetical protein HCUR_00521 [Holospora curviuscula]